MATTIQLLRSDIPQQRPDPGVLVNGVPMVNIHESEPGLFFSSRDGSLVKIGPVSIGDSAPNSSPQGETGNCVGELWYDSTSTSQELKVFDGNNWRPASPGLTLNSQAKNSVFAAPATAAGPPSFRVLEASDIPSIGSSRVDYAYSTSLPTRSVLEKLQDIPSVKDFGAVGNGTDDDTTEIDSALAVSDVLIFPAGSYSYIGTNIDKLLSGKCLGPGEILFGGLSYPVQRVTAQNHMWAGEFFSWEMGTSINFSTAQRIHIPSGVTVARENFQGDARATQAPGPGGKDYALRIIRNANTTSELPATVVLNLTEAETAPLRGKDCCLTFNARRDSAFSGGSLINYRVQSSSEAEQAITRDDGLYSSGHNTITSGSVTLSEQFRNSTTPFYVNFTVPENSSQVAVVFTINFSGTASSSDFVDLAAVRVTIGQDPQIPALDSPTTLLEKGRSRYQTSYPYGLGRGSFTEQGALQAIAVAAQAPWGFAADVRFSPKMAVPPQFTFQAPGSGVEFRWLNKDTSSFVSGSAYNLSDSGVTITNASAVTAGHRFMCHWSASAVL